MKKIIKFENVINRHAIIIIIILFIFSVIIRYSLIPCPERITIYNDELRSYGIAESIATGRGISIFNTNHYFTEILYCLIISPAFFFRFDRVIQFRVIAVINSILICSGIFPTYLLAKRISKGKEIFALLFGCIYCILPDLTYSLLYYSENIQLPMTIWMIYTIYIIFSDAREIVSLRYVIEQFIIGILFSLLYMSKMVSLIFPIAYFVTLLFEMFINKEKFRNKDYIKKRLVGYAFSILIFGVFLIIIFCFFLGGRSFLRMGVMNPNVLDSYEKYIYLLYGILYYLLNVCLAVGIVPIIIPLINFKKLTHTDKVLYAFLMIALGGLAIVNSYTCSLREDFPHLIPKANVRYAGWFFLPMWMVYGNALKESISHKKKQFLLLIGVIVGALYMVVYKGVTYSQADQTMLWYLVNFTEKQMIYIGIFITIFIVASLLVFYKSPYLHICVFSVIMLVILLYDNVYTIKARIQDHVISKKDYSEISMVESFIIQHPDSEFLYVINDRTIDKFEKLGDTYLNYQNVTRISLYEILEHQLEDGTINLNDIENERLTEINNIDYLIVEQDWGTEFEDYNAKDVTNSEYYDILENRNDGNKVISAINFWWSVPLGTKIFNISASRFFTQFEEDGTGGFVSQENKQGSLLFGPYTTLSPGKYDITFLYSYDGDLEEGTPLGRVGIRGSEDLTAYDTIFYAGDEYVSLNDITISNFCSQFETLMITSNSNIRVYAIKITRK
ncbi:hypothetical protein [Butyrivibrio sp. AC2005]|uniref:hypothetical protein n=1 Tax=Butyrivibrio sp. AC2005 TaxID=1280672 RepID=UPI0003F8E606|nr:hypothetical protein [Butyrivibrio sp. AC2005]